MNNALIDIQQAASARFCGRKAFVRALVLGCAVSFASGTVFAGQERDRDRDAQRNAPPPAQPVREQPRQEHIAPPPPQPRQFDSRQFDSRMYDVRAEEQRRQAQQQQDQGARRGRLTPDERRELRRQINEAGTDLYPNTPRR